MLGASEDELVATTSQILVPITVSEVVSNGDFRFLAINDTHSDLSGLRDCDVIGRSPSDLLKTDEAEQVYARYREAARTAQPCTYEELLTLPSGQFWWRSSINPIRDSLGEVKRLCVSSVPIDIEVKLRNIARDLMSDLKEIQSAQSIITSVAEGMERTLASVTNIAEAVKLLGDELPEDEQALLTLLIRITRSADETLINAKKNGLDRVSGVLEQALLKEGELAKLLDRVDRVKTVQADGALY